MIVRRVVGWGTKALHYERFGGLDQFIVGELPDPHVGPDTLLVKVVAAGINPVDPGPHRGDGDEASPEDASATGLCRDSL